MRERNPIDLWPVFVAFRGVTGSQTPCWVVRPPYLPQPLQNSYYPSLNPNRNIVDNRYCLILSRTNIEVTTDILFIILVDFGLGPKWTSISQLIYSLGVKFKTLQSF